MKLELDYMYIVYCLLCACGLIFIDIVVAFVKKQYLKRKYAPLKKGDLIIWENPPFLFRFRVYSINENTARDKDGNFYFIDNFRKMTFKEKIKFYLNKK